MYQQALLSWGNLQYEESQLVAVAGADWRAILDAATAHFREAGCNETDIRGARHRHTSDRGCVFPFQQLHIYAALFMKFGLISTPRNLLF